MCVAPVLSQEPEHTEDDDYDRGDTADGAADNCANVAAVGSAVWRAARGRRGRGDIDISGGQAAWAINEYESAWDISNASLPTRALEARKLLRRRV